MPIRWPLKRFLGSTDRPGKHGSKAIDSDMSEITRLRVSCLLRIYGSIRTLIPERAQAEIWLHTSNTATLFAGQAPFECMAAGQLDSLMSIASYLESQTGMDFS